MTPRSFNGWRDWAMANLNYTLGDAEKLAEQRLEQQRLRRLGANIVDEHAEDLLQLFQDSEQRDASVPSQEDAGVARPHRQRPPAAPSKDSGRGTGDHRVAGEVHGPPSSSRDQPRPEYDPRTSDWQGF